MSDQVQDPYEIERVRMLGAIEKVVTDIFPPDEAIKLVRAARKMDNTQLYRMLMFMQMIFNKVLTYTGDGENGDKTS